MVIKRTKINVLNWNGARKSQPIWGKWKKKKERQGKKLMISVIIFSDNPVQILQSLYIDKEFPICKKVLLFKNSFTKFFFEFYIEWHNGNIVLMW